MRSIEQVGDRLSPEVRQHLDSVLGWRGFGLGYSEASERAAVNPMDAVRKTAAGNPMDAVRKTAAGDPIDVVRKTGLGEFTATEPHTLLERPRASAPPLLERRALKDRVGDRLEQIGAMLEGTGARLADTLGPMRAARRVRDGVRSRVETRVDRMSGPVSGALQSAEPRVSSVRENAVGELRLGRIWWPDESVAERNDAQREAERNDARRETESQTVPTTYPRALGMKPPAKSPEQLSGASPDVAALTPPRYAGMGAPSSGLSRLAPTVSDREPTMSDPDLGTKEPDTFASPESSRNDRSRLFSLWSLVPAFLRRSERRPTTLFGDLPGAEISESACSEEAVADHDAPIALERLGRLIAADKERPERNLVDRAASDSSESH